MDRQNLTKKNVPVLHKIERTSKKKIKALYLGNFSSGIQNS